MEDSEIRQHIATLVEEEHRLLEHGERGKLTADDHQRLEQISVRLDQFWDLLRQRRARQEFGQDPAVAHIRSEDIVEHYRQ